MFFLAFSVGFLLTLIYSVFYFFIDAKAGSLAGLLCFICWVGISFLASRLGFSLSWRAHLTLVNFFDHVVLVAQIVCWTGQFIGHGVFEKRQKRAPALLDNLAQAFIMAPFFVLLEALQTLFGYEPYTGFHAIAQAKVDAKITEWKETKQKLVS